MLKRIVINLLIVVLNVLAFSGAFLGIQISPENLFEAFTGVVIIILSVLLFLIFNTNIARKKPVGQATQHYDDKRSVKKALYAEFEDSEFVKQNDTSLIFGKSFAAIKHQKESFNKKRITIENLLAEKFDVNEITFRKFYNAVADVVSLFNTNTESALNKIKAFEDANVATSQKEILQEYQNFIATATKSNEQIILKMDKLILEISKLKNKMHGDIENMDEIKEIDKLIQNIKLYRD